MPTRILSGACLVVMVLGGGVVASSGDRVGPRANRPLSIWANRR